MPQWQADQITTPARYTLRLQPSQSTLIIAMDYLGSEGRYTDRNIFRPTLERGAITYPLSLGSDHRLARRHIK